MLETRNNVFGWHIFSAYNMGEGCYASQLLVCLLEIRASCDVTLFRRTIF